MQDKKATIKKEIENQNEIQESSSQAARRTDNSLPFTLLNLRRTGNKESQSCKQ